MSAVRQDFGAGCLIGMLIGAGLSLGAVSAYTFLYKNEVAKTFKSQKSAAALAFNRQNLVLDPSRSHEKEVGWAGDLYLDCKNGAHVLKRHDGTTRFWSVKGLDAASAKAACQAAGQEYGGPSAQ